MDYKVELQNNNTDLQSLINKANTLPNKVNLDTEIVAQDAVIAQIQSALEGKAAGGGSGVQYDTCKLNINITGGSYAMSATFGMVVVNGSTVEYVYGVNRINAASYDVLCGSYVHISSMNGMYALGSVLVNGVDMSIFADPYESEHISYFQVPNENGATVQVDIALVPVM